nr:beta-galactosidase [Aquimarina amphilecti]
MASVGFQYIKWKDFEPTNGNFDFNAVEDVINRPGSAGKHVILRLYTDWFGTEQDSDAGPQWLYTDFGVSRLQSGNKYITDYNNPNYINQAIEAIEALATRYNNDPRVYNIQIGILGYWGEWHTFSYDDPNFNISETAKNQIITSYKSNFSNKKIMGRYPWRDPLSTTGNIGFHNDFLYLIMVIVMSLMKLSNKETNGSKVL